MKVHLTLTDIHFHTRQHIITVLLVTIFITICTARSPTPCEIQKVDEAGTHIFCSSITNFDTIVSYLEQVNAVPSHLVIARSPSLVLTKQSFQNPVFANVERLDLALNGITVFNPEPLTGLGKLHMLGLLANNLTDIDENTFAGLNLTVIQLDDNEISNIAEGTFSHQVNLADLSISGNKLTHLPATLFHGLIDLHSLDLNRNELASIDDHLFQDSVYLNELRLSNNQISSLGANTLKTLSKLFKLDLSGNQLEAIAQEVFEGNTELSGLDLSNNKFPDLYSVFLNISSLKELIIQNNNIDTLPYDFFSLTPNIVIINLGNNKLNTTVTSVFENLTKLNLVYVGGNNLMSVLVAGVRSVEEGNDLPRYSIIVASNEFDCSQDDFPSFRVWFISHGFNFEKVIKCKEGTITGVVSE